ncbi:unnamed protein product [Trifolium pratense]|uniref:Uncharacterized protein n=1 Tax=Trifolium pratense TaxID=57577 RepID=A0ACB0JYV1_TRIPR|nr:unnamed protein product [Trifolium pratense]
MGNCCTSSSSTSMEWGGEDWESLRSSSPSTKPKNSSSSSRSKVFDESAHVRKEENNNLLGKLRDSSDANGKVTLKISKSELAELLGAIQQNNNNNNNDQQQPHKQKKELASAEEVLFRLMKTRDHQIISSHWKPVLDTIPEC